jgi:hypothetical protein
MSYSNVVGRWIEADPEEYVDGPNMYQMEDGGSVGRLDPLGESVAASQPTTAPSTIFSPVPKGSVKWPGGGYDYWIKYRVPDRLTDYMQVNIQETRATIDGKETSDPPDVTLDPFNKDQSRGNRVTNNTSLTDLEGLDHQLLQLQASCVKGYIAIVHALYYGGYVLGGKTVAATTTPLGWSLKPKDDPNRGPTGTLGEYIGGYISVYQFVSRDGKTGSRLDVVGSPGSYGASEPFTDGPLAGELGPPRGFPSPANADSAIGKIVADPGLIAAGFGN